MIYVLPKDFYSNFTSAVSSKDNDAKKDMIVSEVADLIVNHKSDVVELLNSCGVKTDANENNKKIITKIVNNGGSPKVQQGIAYLIASKHGLAVIDTVKSNSNVEGKSISVDPVSAIASAVGNVFQGLGKIFGSDKDVAKIQAEAQADANRAVLIQTILNATLAQQGKKQSNTGLYVGIAIAAVVLITAGYFLLRKK